MSSLTKNQENLAKKAIAVYYPTFMGGGAEAVCLWLLEALKNKYNLTLFTVGEVDFNKLNFMYGTHLSPETVKVKSLVSENFSFLSYFVIANNPNIRMIFFHFLLRYFKANISHYDLGISAYNAADLGRKGIQYIHWINAVEGKPFHRRISQFSEEQLKSNVSVSNSYLVADTVKKHYGIDSVVVYPPVLIEPSNVSWEEKENAFICSGRLTQAKSPDRVISILRQVRQKGFDIKLYLTGGGGGVYGVKYQRFLKKLIRENSDWIRLYENLKYKDYVSLLYQCKYGIHYKKEPFGISIAEMVKAGAVPFVRSEGGQIEIVGEENSDLLFDNAENAVEKIINVLSSPEKQEKLRTSLGERQKRFSTEKFMADMTQVVDSYFATGA
ncbi:MAG: glycosyltransferase [Halothece sp.]